MNKRVGIIGLGFGAQVHLPAFASEGWEVAAVCSRTRDKTRAAADAAGVKDVHTDPAELFARTDIDAVAISTPPATHHPLSIAALNAGKHVVCEKPFAMSAAEGAEMRDAAARTGRTAMVAHEFRFAPQRRHVKQLLRDGYIGLMQDLYDTEFYFDRLENLFLTRRFDPARVRNDYWRQHPWQKWRSQSLDALRALGLFLRLMNNVPDPELRRIYRRRMTRMIRRRPDPNLLLICVLKCALHYHHYTMSRAMVEQRMLVNTF